jgi:choline dehydrogenase
MLIFLEGGIAGCILAPRFSEDPTISVLVLERGFVNDRLMSRISLITSNIFDKSYGVVTTTSEPMTHCDGRQSPVVSCEALGGASRINAMLYTRGTVADYDAWRDLGHPEWGYEKILRYFVKGENTLTRPGSSYRGKSGY